jgi:hypothetical protein
MLPTVVCYTVRVDVDRIVHVCPSEDEGFEGHDVSWLVIENSFIGERYHFDSTFLASDIR